MRRLVVVLMVMMLLGTYVSAIAEETATPYYTYTSILRVSFEIGSGRATAGGSICPKNNQATKVVVKLQQNIDGTWRTIGEWSSQCSSGTSEVIGSEEIDHGYDYRVYVYGTVHDSNGNVIETATKYSAIKSY